MENVNINEKRQQRAVNTKNIAMLELSDRYFKVAIIKVLWRWITKKSWKKWKNKISQQRKRKYFKNSNEKFETENTTEINKFNRRAQQWNGGHRRNGQLTWRENNRSYLIYQQSKNRLGKIKETDYKDLQDYNKR